ncbi:hypothetical protein [Isoptericola halotolerans]|uniref:hypothetical protein n=1 Tax=Isoptericola halotolerans TaxID=300560 RepID=UPI0031D0626F
MFRTYWSNGWIDDGDRQTAPEDLAYAKDHGVMFDPVTWTHDESVSRIQRLRDTGLGSVVANGFVASLSSRRLDRRSALASWSMVERLTPHAFQPVVAGEGLDDGGTVTRSDVVCETCRDAPADGQLTARQVDRDIDLNVLSFERLKWGGVRHDDLVYARFDLEQLARTAAHDPTAEDRTLLQRVLAVIEDLDPEATAGGLVRALRPVLPGTVAEHRAFVEILGTARVLRPRGAERPEHLRSDWGAAGQWRGGDRYDVHRVRQLFPGAVQV